MSPTLSFVAAVLLTPAADTPKLAVYPRAELLIEAPELAKQIDKVRILDVRSRKKYLAGHIPGAFWVDHDTWSKAFAAGQDPQVWGERVGKLAITVDTPVVLYDDEQAKAAARIWWVLRYWGVKDARLLNGGWTAWQASGGPTSQDEPPAGTTAATLQAANQRLATRVYVEEQLKDKKSQIIDARSKGEFCGETITAKRSGAIPGAIHLEWSDAIDPHTQRFKTPEELSRLLKDAGIDPARPALTYCQSGGRAAVMAFTLELMGAKDVRNYYRSWAEWGNADDTPIETPKPKK
jgi:thiosulfate/3-mercaptopyruvate sulfurtransferase